MRLLLVLFALVLLVPASASAEAWTKLVDRERQFTMRFPGPPESQDITYQTAKGALLPARVYSLERGTARYSLTIVDFSSRPEEEEAARPHAAEALKRKGDAVHDDFAWQDGLPGDHLTVTTTDGLRISAVLHVFEHRLYIAEASDVKGSPFGEPFVYSLIITHKDGTWLNLDSFNREDINAFEDPY